MIEHESLSQGAIGRLDMTHREQALAAAQHERAPRERPDACRDAPTINGRGRALGSRVPERHEQLVGMGDLPPRRGG